MPPRRVAVLLVIALTALAVLGTTAPAWAHGVPGAASRNDLTRDELASATAVNRDELALATAVNHDAVPSSLPVDASTSPDFPWQVVLAGLAAVAFGAHRRRRRVLAFALVLLLVTFAFEVGLHSVHHGADPHQIADCAAAAASAHLSATPVACLVAGEVTLPAVATTTEIDPSRSPLSPLRPDQGRAPPA